MTPELQATCHSLISINANHTSAAVYSGKDKMLINIKSVGDHARCYSSRQSKAPFFNSVSRCKIYMFHRVFCLLPSSSPWGELHALKL